MPKIKTLLFTEMLIWDSLVFSHLQEDSRNKEKNIHVEALNEGNGIWHSSEEEGGGRKLHSGEIRPQEPS